MKNFSADLLLISASGRIYSLTGLKRLASSLLNSAAKDVDDPLRGCESTINAGNISTHEYQVPRNDPGKTAGTCHSAEFREKHL